MFCARQTILDRSFVAVLRSRSVPSMVVAPVSMANKVVWDAIIKASKSSLKILISLSESYSIGVEAVGLSQVVFFVLTCQ